MDISEELINFLEFIVIGIVISVIFDFFRAYRKNKRISAFFVAFQDIIYFLIATFVIVLGVINILDSSMRLYVFIAIGIGIGIYFSVMSKYVLNIYLKIFNMSKKILDFFLLPFTYIKGIFVKIYSFLRKIVKKCCKKFSNMVTLICKAYTALTVIFSKLFKLKNKPKKIKKQKREK